MLPKLTRSTSIQIVINVRLVYFLYFFSLFVVSFFVLTSNVIKVDSVVENAAAMRPPAESQDFSLRPSLQRA